MSVDSALDQLRAGSPADVKHAVATLQAAADAGEAEAWRHLATLAGAGVGLPQSWPRAVRFLLNAALAGSASAQGQLKVLCANPALADLDQDNPQHWRRLCALVKIEDWLKASEKQVLNASPRVVAISGFLSPASCAWLIGLAAGRLTHAPTYGPDGSPSTADAGRTNTAFEFGIVDCDIVVLLTRLRIAATIGVPVQALEASQVLHYDLGEAFARHHDWLDPALPEVAAAGQRIVTFLVYLNDAFQGGETEFPHLGIRRRGAVGDALYFANLTADGAPDHRTLHAGLAPVSGEKWVWSQWVRNLARM